MSKSKLWDKGDNCLKVSLYCVGMWMQRKVGKNLKNQKLFMAIAYHYYKDIMDIAETMKKECRLDKWTGHRKSDQYRWSNSGSQNLKDNTLFKRPTYWIQKHVLSYMRIDPYKGLNHDQYRAYFIYLYLTKDKIGALKVIFGYMYRFGFTPSMMEHCILKPHAYIMLLATIWKPLHYLVLPLFKLSMRRNLAKPIEDSTTNKISLLPTMELLGIKLTAYAEQYADYRVYVRRVYAEYWPENTEEDPHGHRMIREALIGGLT